MKDVVSLKMVLPRIPNIELVALEGLEHLARHLGIADDKIGEAKILVTEAVINALEHAGDKNHAVRVEFQMTPRELVINVRDYGKGFEPADVAEPDLQAKLDAKSKRGWGLKLMRSLSDGFQIASSSRGTKIIITKLLQ